MSVRASEVGLGVGLLVLLAGFWVVTGSCGLGVSHDSIFYLSGAQRLATGQGYGYCGQGDCKPITHYPPGYSSLIAVGVGLGLGAAEAARLLHVLLLGLVLVLARWLLVLWRPQVTTGRQLGLLVYLGLGFPLLQSGLFAWSELLFLVVLLASLVVYKLVLLDAKGAWGWVLLLGLLVAGAVLVRYVGLVWGLGVGFGLLLQRGRLGGMRRVLQAGVYGLVVLGPFGAWLLYSQWVSGSASPRELGYRPLPGAKLWQLLETWASWVWPQNWLLEPVVVLGALATLLVVCWLVLRLVRTGLAPGQGLALGFVGLYLVFLQFSLRWVDPGTPLDNRILSPVWLLLGVLGFAVWPQPRRLWAVFAAAWLVLAPVVPGVQLAGRAYQHGLGFAAVDKQQDPLVQILRRAPQGHMFYGLGWDPLYLSWLAGRPVRPMPALYALAGQPGRLSQPHFLVSRDSLGPQLAAEEAYIREIWTPGAVSLYRDQLYCLPLGELRDAGHWSACCQAMRDTAAWLQVRQVTSP